MKRVKRFDSDLHLFRTRYTITPERLKPIGGWFMVPSFAAVGGHLSKCARSGGEIYDHALASTTPSEKGFVLPSWWIKSDFA